MIDRNLLPLTGADRHEFEAGVESMKDYLTDNVAIGDLLAAMLLRIERLEDGLQDFIDESSEGGE